MRQSRMGGRWGSRRKEGVAMTQAPPTWLTDIANALGILFKSRHDTFISTAQRPRLRSRSRPDSPQCTRTP